MFKEIDIVRLKRDILDVVDSTGRTVSVPAGTLGTIVMIYNPADLGLKTDDPINYEVDFCDSDGRTLAVLEVSEPDLEMQQSYEERVANSKQNRADTDSSADN